MTESKSKPRKEKPKILTENFWERPVSLEKGDKDASNIYWATGYATSQWEFLEDQLAQIFLTMTSAPGPYRRSLRRAYGSIFGGAGRRKAILAAAEGYFGGYWKYSVLRETLVEKLNAIGWASKLRDDVVHGIVFDSIGVITDSGEQKDCGAFLMPPDYNTDRTTAQAQPDQLLAFTRARYRYTSAQINNFANNFSELRTMLEKYRPSLEMQKDGTIKLVTDLIGSGEIPKDA